MLFRSSKLAGAFIVAQLMVALTAANAWAQAGLFLPGAGPVNRSMGGTAVAAPIDSIGSLFWNPATSTAIPSSMDFGLELLIPHSTLGSSLPASAFGPGVPPVPLADNTGSRAGVFALPSVALIYTPEGMPVTFGFGAFPVAGFGVNYPASFSNPILTPQPPNGLGLGALYSQLQVLQIVPSVAMQVTDRLSIAAARTVTLASLDADPLFIVSPNANGSFPPGTHSRVTWGAGFVLGAFYTLDGGWRVGASFKSPQWFENFHFQSVDARGLPRPASFQPGLPMIPSIGVAYTGFDRWLLAADFRFVDYANTPLFHLSGFDSTGAARGLGWNSVFAMSVGAQYRLTDSLSLRLGYTYNGNPIPDSQSSFNVASPTIIEHSVAFGATYRVTDAFSLSLSYAHGFENSIQGPLVTALGPVPGSSVRSRALYDSFLLGATVKFGPR